MIENLPERIKETCTAEQQRALAKVTDSLSGLIWWKVGEGKTRIGIYWFATLQNTFKWKQSVCLVVCRRKAFNDWRAEIELLMPEALVFEDSLPAHAGENPCFCLLSDGMFARKEFIQDSRIRCVILDEGWMYNNHKSAKSLTARNYSLRRYMLLLTGTVMKARDVREIYSETMAIRKHRLLAKNLTDFTSQYQVVSNFSGFPTYSPRPGAYKMICDRLQSCLDVHFPSGARQVINQFHDIDPTREQLAHFRELREFYSLELYDLEYKNALTIILKTQQIANGFITKPSGEVIHIPSNKPEKLRDECRDIIDSGQRAVVWCAFRYDVEFLSHYLDFATLQMVGGKEFDLDRWSRGNIRICLATEASGSSVNHFANVQYGIYYSANFKWQDMQQSRGRTNRFSSQHTSCYYKYLQVRRSLDSYIYRTALASGSAEKKLLEFGEVNNWLKDGTGT